MTTKAAEELYRSQHNYSIEGKKYAVYNPYSKNIMDLPIIYGFNKGCDDNSWYTGILLAEDGTKLDYHICSHEDYMRADLGILEGTCDTRHKTFIKHYPNGYRMDFVSLEDIENHTGLKKARGLNQRKAEK